MLYFVHTFRVFVIIFLYWRFVMIFYLLRGCLHSRFLHPFLGRKKREWRQTLRRALDEKVGGPSFFGEGGGVALF
jgi:hypothetical protein